MSPTKQPEIRFSAHIAKPEPMELVDRRVAPLKHEDGIRAHRYKFVSNEFSTPRGLPIQFDVTLEGALWLSIRSANVSLFKVEVLDNYLSAALRLPTDEELHFSIQIVR